MPIGKALLIAGLALAVLGAILWRAPGLLSWIGRLPGDIHYEKNGVSVHFPLTSMILISVVLSLLLNFCARR